MHFLKTILTYFSNTLTTAAVDKRRLLSRLQL